MPTTTAEKRIYEAMFLVDAGEASANWDKVLSTINTVMERGKAEVISVRKWDEMRLCYDIGSCHRGVYILCYFRGDPESIKSMERDVQLNEQLLRVLILRGDHLNEEDMSAPTPLMAAAEAAVRAKEEAAERAEAAEARRLAAEDQTAAAAADADDPPPDGDDQGATAMAPPAVDAGGEKDDAGDGDEPKETP